jgi:hypothetical protein
VAVAPVVLPHELGHALPAVLAGLSWRVRLLPEWEGSATPLGQFDATLSATTPRWLIRLVAVAPLPLYLGVAVLLGAVELPTPVAVLAVLFCAAGATLSAGDLAIAANPTAAREAGQFRVTAAGWESPVADLLTVVTTVVVALLVLA